MINFIPFIVFVVLWYAVAKHFKGKGKGEFIRHLTGFLVGALGLIVSVIAIAPKPDTSAATEQKTEAVAVKDTPAETAKEESKAVVEEKKTEPKEEPAKTQDPVVETSKATE